MTTISPNPLSLQEYLRKESGVNGGIGLLSANERDSYSSEWLLQHALLVQTAEGEVMKMDGDEMPLVYFGTLEQPTSGSSANGSFMDEPTETPFQLDMAPVRIRGTINKETMDLVADVGIVPSPNVFYKLRELKGNFIDSPEGISTGDLDTPWYKGAIVIRKDDIKDEQGQVMGLLKLMTGLTWVGLGVKVAKAVLPLII